MESIINRIIFILSLLSFLIGCGGQNYNHIPSREYVMNTRIALNKVIHGMTKQQVLDIAGQPIKRGEGTSIVSSIYNIDRNRAIWFYTINTGGNLGPMKKMVAELRESKKSRARILGQFLPLCFDWSGRVTPLSERYLNSIPIT